MQKESGKHSVDNFITLLEFIADPAIVIDEKANYLFMNKSFEKGTGYKSEEWVGKSVFMSDKLTKEDAALLKRNMEKRLQGLKFKPYEISLKNSKNQKRTYELNAKKIDFNSKTAILILFRDVTNRKLVEQKLKDNSQKLTTLVNMKVKEIEENAEKVKIIFNSAQDAISFIEPNGRLIDFNHSALKLHGYSSRAEVKELNIFSLIPEREQKRAALSLANLAKTGKLKTLEYMLLRKNGEEFPAEVSSSPVRDANGQLLGFVVNTRDISERKKLQDDLVASEAKFRAIANSAINAVVLLDEEDTITFWNSSAERMFGYTAHEAIDKKLSDLVVPLAGRVGHRRLVKELAHSDDSSHRTFDINAVRRDNTVFPAELSATKLQLKGSRYVVGIIHDISNRKKVEEAIKQERDVLETVTESIGAGLAIISRDYRILWANKLLRTMKKFDIHNKRCYTVFNDVTGVCPDCGVMKVFNNNEPINRHDYRFTSSGKQNCIELIVTPIKDKDGNIIAALELAIDVTEKRKLESQHSTKLERLVAERTRQLEETQEKLVKTERLAAIGELAAMVGHDLRNPLTGMKAATYYLKGKTKSDPNPKTIEMLDLIDTCIDQSNKIVNDLLEYSRILKLEYSENTPLVFLEYALSTVKPPKHIKITHQVTGNRPVKFDSPKMLRVIQNVTKNAFDAMPKNGTLAISSQQTSKNWVITFTDSGEGMSKDTLIKLGNPLFTTKAKGMGFGIPICKRIVEAHGGKLLIDSVLGQGTTVTIKIPLKPEGIKHSQA